MSFHVYSIHNGAGMQRGTFAVAASAIARANTIAETERETIAEVRDGDDALVHETRDRAS
jgi:hypothetical protein